MSKAKPYHYLYKGRLVVIVARLIRRTTLSYLLKSHVSLKSIQFAISVLALVFQVHT